MVSSVSSTALAAIQLNMQQLDAAAGGAPGVESSVAMTQAVAQIELNAQVLQAADEMVGTLLDIMA